jgi:predicted nucleic acid-binding protein
VPGLVLDASVALAWALSGEVHQGRAAVVMEQLVLAGAIVPPLWHLEVANALVVNQRRGRLPADRVPLLLRRLAALPIAVDQDMTSHVWTETVTLALAQGLSLYDAAYVELAKRTGLKLATLDERLGRAELAVGVARVG